MKDEEDFQYWDEFIREIKTMFSNKSKVTDAEWKIKTFKQSKKYIVDYMIKFKVLAMKAKTNNMHTIFLLKNIRTDIMKTILGYPLITTPETLREWKVVITSVS